MVPGPGTRPRGLRRSVHSVTGGLPEVPRGLRMGPPGSRGASCPWVPTAGAAGQFRHGRRDVHHATVLRCRLRSWSLEGSGLVGVRGRRGSALSFSACRKVRRDRRTWGFVQLWRTPKGPSQSVVQCLVPLCVPASRRPTQVTLAASITRSRIRLRGSAWHGCDRSTGRGDGAHACTDRRPTPEGVTCG